MKRLKMILTNLKLENFKKYVSHSISFEEGLTGIIGKNGSGKSTIFEAILFALYGELKNKGDKEIVRNANASIKDVVSVDLDFEFENTPYKISREFRGKTLSANAKLYKNEELLITGAKETTAYIVKLTKMNKDAFSHTLFASQKELTSLSTKKPEDRKKMIRKLLGLEKIDYIEKELIEKSRDLKRDISAYIEILLSSDDIKDKKEHIVKHKEQLDIYTNTSIEKAKHIDSIKLQELDIRKELEVYIQTKEKKQNLFSNLELLKNTINAHISNQTKLAREIELLNEKQKELKGLENVKGKYTKLHDSIKEQEQLKEYHIRKERLLEEQKNLREHYKKSKDTINTLEQESSLHGELVKKEKELLGIQEEIKQELIKLNQKEKELVQEIAGEEKLIADINKKIQNIKNLGRDSNCPTCTRPLLDEYDNVISSLEAIVKTAQEQKISKTKEELEKLGMLKTAQEQIQKQNSTEYFEVSKSLNLCESKKRDLFIEKEHFVKVEAQGMKNKEELAKLEIYTYDNTIHQNLIEKQKELKVKYEYVLSLETILKRADALKQEYTNTNANIEKLSKEYNEKELSYKEINYDEVKHKEKQKQFDEVQVLKEQELNLLNELKVQIATIQGQIKNIQETLDNNEIQLAKVQTKKDDLQDYEKIKISLAEFKTKLNSKVAPRISDIASNMFAQITKGKYQHIEVSNDFDFYIYDEGKKYPIERFSGGEIDLANLVLRIAISKTLSELSGASSVEFLAFDEVFGSQDESRRMEILEAFHTIKEQYRQIFLISHEMEIKEMFERVVEV